MPHSSQKQNFPSLMLPTSSPKRSVWQLPSGQNLAEFALRAGILAPKLLLTSPSRRRAIEIPSSVSGDSARRAGRNK